MGGERGADRDLVLASCKAGQAGAWDWLVAKYERLVFSIPRSYGVSREDADVSQAAFIALIGGLDSLTEESHVKAWLATVARRHTWRLMGEAAARAPEMGAAGAPRGLRGRPGPAPDHERLLCTFDVMQRTAAVNRTLQLRASETTRGQARREAFLRQSVVWLERGCLA